MCRTGDAVACDRCARMLEHLEVRAAVEGDGPAIGEAHAAAWLAAYGGIFEASFLQGAAESRRVGWPHAVRALVAAPNLLLVGTLEKRVVAFAHAVPTAAPDSAEILAFYC